MKAKANKFTAFVLILVQLVAVMIISLQFKLDTSGLESEDFFFHIFGFVAMSLLVVFAMPFYISFPSKGNLMSVITAVFLYAFCFELSLIFTKLMDTIINNWSEDYDTFMITVADVHVILASVLSALIAFSGVVGKVSLIQMTVVAAVDVLMFSIAHAIVKDSLYFDISLITLANLVGAGVAAGAGAVLCKMNGKSKDTVVDASKAPAMTHAFMSVAVLAQFALLPLTAASRVTGENWLPTVFTVLMAGISGAIACFWTDFIIGKCYLSAGVIARSVVGPFILMAAVAPLRVNPGYAMMAGTLYGIFSVWILHKAPSHGHRTIRTHLVPAFFGNLLVAVLALRRGAGGTGFDDVTESTTKLILAQVLYPLMAVAMGVAGGLGSMLLSRSMMPLSAEEVNVDAHHVKCE
eukprot:gnl/Dysnectes_brevis/755_a830_4070.p1 GENE.gnl/Dysnectes_brevis/755_a830_4070~~gnl/Dysnectes_brevis/755_a830_4070.p1  ORF type:complete len:417 (-),score=128.63 gnl/Dysnectes_brevis/755_a830_4070:94-1317(-)